MTIKNSHTQSYFRQNFRIFFASKMQLIETALDTDEKDRNFYKHVCNKKKVVEFTENNKVQSQNGPLFKSIKTFYCANFGRKKIMNVI